MDSMSSPRSTSLDSAKVGAAYGIVQDLATAALHTVTDLLLVNIQPDVIRRLHGGASMVSLNQRVR